MQRAVNVLTMCLLSAGASAAIAEELCLVAHYDGAGLIEGQPRGPLSKFGAGVVIRGTETGAGAPYMGSGKAEALYDFQVLTPRGLMPAPPVVNSPQGQALNAFGLHATDSPDGAIVSDILGGPITPPGDVGNGAVFPLIALDDSIPAMIEAPYPYAYQFGSSLALADSILLIGAWTTNIGDQQEQGAAYAYVWDGENWVLEAELLGPGTNQFDHVGGSVALSANGLALIGANGFKANGFNSNGAVFAFQRTPDGQWVYDQTLIEPFGQIGNIRFGNDVAMSEDGSTAVITAPNADGQDGAAYVYNRVGGQWSFVQKIIPSNPVGSFPMYGNALALSDDASFLAVSDSDDSQAGFSAGALYVYRRKSTTGLYEEIAKMLPPDPSFDDYFAGSVDIDGDLLVAGQVVDYESGGVGGIYVYAGVLDLDCNGNDQPDACDIAAGISQDLDNDGTPDECQVPGDMDGDGDVDLTDHAAFVACLSGPNSDVPADCVLADLQNDADVDLADCAEFQNALGIR